MRWAAMVLMATLLLATPASAPQQAYRVEHMTRIGWDEMHDAVLEMMADCVGTEPPDSIRWYAASAIVRTRDSQTMRGITDLRTGRVVLALPYVYDGRVISHEALHVLLGGEADMDTAHRCALDPMRAVNMRNQP